MMFAQMCRTSNILLCILLHKAFANSLTTLEETLMSTNDDISHSNQHTTDPELSSDSSRPEATIVTSSGDTSIKAKPKRRSSIGVVTRRQSKGKAHGVPKKHKTSTSEPSVVTQIQSSTDDDGKFSLETMDDETGTTGGWMLDFIGTQTSADKIITTSFGDLYSDKDVYDQETGAIREQKRDTSNTGMGDTSQEIVYFLCVLVGCIVFTTGALSAKTHMKKHQQNPDGNPHPSSLDHRIQEEDYDYTRTDEEAVDDYQLKAHWLSELGNKM